MRKFYTFLSVMCVATVTLMLSACSSRDYRETLPADAAAVIAVNPQALADKAEVGDFTQSIYYQMAQMLLAQQQEMSAEERDYLLQLIAHPGTSGLDVEKEVFIFVGKDKNTVLTQPEVGMLFSVKSSTKVETFFDWIAEKSGLEPQTENGVTFLESVGQNSTYIAYTKESFLIYTEQNPDLTQTKATVMQLLSQKKAESLMGKPEIAAELNAGNDVQLVFNYGPLMNMSEMQMQIPGFEFLAKMYYTGTINFEVGKIVSEGKVVFCDKEAEKQYRALGDMFPEKLKGNFLSLLPQTNMAVLGVALQGEKMYEILAQNPMYGMVFASVPQVGTIMNSIAGDLALSFHGMLPDGNTPALSMLVELRDAADLNTLMEMVPAEFVQLAPNQYQMKDYPVYFGLNGKTLYATTDPSAVAYLTGKSTSDYKAGVESLFRDAYVAMKIDLVQIREMLAGMVANGQLEPQIGMALPYLALFESIEGSTDANGAGSLVINMADKQKNAAAVLYATVEDVVQMIAATSM